MGNKSKKRKQQEQESSGSSNNQSSVHNEVSSVLGAANNVLYGLNADSDQCFSDMPISSTPKVSSACSSTNLDLAGHILDTNKKLEFIVSKLSKLDSIEQKLDRLDTTVKLLEQKVKKVETITTEFEKTVNFVAGKVDDFDQRSKTAENKMAGLVREQKKICEEVVKQKTTMDSEFEQTKKEQDEMKEAVLDLKCRSMKNNLVFTGLGGESNGENVEDKLRDFIFNELGLEERIEFSNVHRFGSFVEGKNRPIVARFLYQYQRIEVLSNARKLKGKPYGINEQFPAEIESQRRRLYPVVKEKRQSGHRVKLVKDRLYVDGVLYDETTAGTNVGRTPRDYDRQTRVKDRVNPS